MLAPLHLEILLNVLTDHTKFVILDVGELVDDQMRIISAKIVKKDRDLVVDLPLEVALLVSGANEPPRHVIVIWNLIPRASWSPSNGLRQKWH